MPSTFSTLKIQLMATGENNTTWGDVTNLNLGTALEEAIVGSADVTFASADVTLTLTDTNASQTARNMRLRCTGTTGGSTRNLIVPAIEKPYIVSNDCADSIIVKNTTGTGITVPAGKTMWVYNNATNVVDAVTNLSSLTLGAALPVASGGTGVTTSTGTVAVVLSNSPTLVTPTLGAASATSIANALGAVGTPSYTFTGDLNTGMWSPAADTLAFSEGGVEAMRITSAGDVGIGTSSPGTKFEVSSSFFNIVASRSTTSFAAFQRFAPSGQQAYDFYTINGVEAGRISVDGANFMAFSTGSAAAERMRIDTSGNVLVGTTSTSPNPGVVLGPSGAIVIGNTAQASGWTFLGFSRSGTSIGSITQSGTTAVLYNLTSDARLKENVANADDASSLIDAIQVRKFDWKSDGSHQRYGFVAQELVEVAPEAVHSPANPDEMMAVDYSKLVPMLVKELQSVRARLAKLEGN